jgi:hypothetical protein
MVFNAIRKSQSDQLLPRNQVWHQSPQSRFIDGCRRVRSSLEAGFAGLGEMHLPSPLREPAGPVGMGSFMMLAWLLDDNWRMDRLVPGRE